MYPPNTDFLPLAGAVSFWLRREAVVARDVLIDGDTRVEIQLVRRWPRYRFGNSIRTISEFCCERSKMMCFPSGVMSNAAYGSLVTEACELATLSCVQIEQPEVLQTPDVRVHEAFAIGQEAIAARAHPD